jgi:hypothetical protein
MRTVTFYEYDELKYDAQKHARYEVSAERYSFDDYRDEFASELLKNELAEKFDCVVDKASVDVEYQNYNGYREPQDFNEASDADDGLYHHTVNGYNATFNKDSVAKLMDVLEAEYGVSLKNKSKVESLELFVRKNTVDAEMTVKGKLSTEDKMFMELLVGRYFSTVVAADLERFLAEHATDHYDEDLFGWFCNVKGFEFKEDGTLV